MSLLHAANMSQLTQNQFPASSTLYKPVEHSQILLHENSSCLAVEAFLHMCNLKVKKVQQENAEFISPSNKLPVLHCDQLVLSEPDAIIQHVQQKFVNLTEHLTNDEKLNLKAYVELVNNILVPAELFITWAHENTANQITKERYGSPYPWPLNSVLYWKKRNSTLKYLNAIGWGKTMSLTKVEESVKRCCRALSQKLGENKLYFFGNRPCELDAIVFGHLFTILTTTLPDNRLAETVQKFENLVHFCKNIDQKYFS